jgi:hypothetical protein
MRDAESERRVLLSAPAGLMVTMSRHPTGPIKRSGSGLDFGT